MKSLDSLGLIVRSTNAGRPKAEKRLEVRIASNGDYVAGFYSGTRTSNGESRGGMSTDFVYRDELNHEQIVAVTTWLREQVLENVA